jgi:hypothetical protein
LSHVHGEVIAIGQAVSGRQAVGRLIIWLRSHIFGYHTTSEAMGGVRRGVNCRGFVEQFLWSRTCAPLSQAR